jgi:2-oxoacid:acceptor oxidoreductase gamma subunit (pyruvate/2-ketoisovalerate family)
MIQIRFHGRGGQGAVVASKILADAAARENKDVQAFPFFGVERRGAPVTAFTKVDTKPIRNKAQIYEPDYVVVLDISLLNLVDVTAGLKEGGWVLLNSHKKPEEFRDRIKKGRLATVDATEIAVRNRLGSKTSPIVNTSILGALVRISDVVSIDTLVESVLEKSPVKKDENAKAAKEAYDETVILEE